MTDIALIWDEQTGGADIAIDAVANDLASDDGLETAVFLSLYTDRRAADDDVIPDGSSDKRGWWGDAVPVVDGDLFGSRLWLLDRAGASQDTVARAQQYASEALAWFVDDKIAASVDVFAELEDSQTLGIQVTINRPDKDPVSFQYLYVWAAQALKRATP